ncbi:MAG: hypothetical protein IJG37_09675 [Synergistaceae bacterium]|nr:hypothetical protein [Synergistaceae bacterium]MBQ6973062.1 hypothetical protein [Synergistaceae bacterium]
MSLRECKVCRTLYDDETYVGTTEICHDCRMRLEGTYGRIHNHIRDSKSIDPHDLQRLADDTGTTPAEMQIIFELGWLERDIQTYGGTVSERQKLAEEFARELQKMIDERKDVYTYGGKIYSRKNKHRHK